MYVRCVVGVLITILCSSAQGEDSGLAKADDAPLILDMVHHNPGEKLYESAYEDPAAIQKMGYNGKVYYLFDSPMLAINWESVDPGIFPKGSKERQWVDKKAARIRMQHAVCRQAGVSAYAMADLVLFPKRLIEKYGVKKTFGNPNDPQTQKFLKAQIDELFTQFPDFDGLVVRIGETYLHDAPHHQGSIRNKRDTEGTIIPLMKLLRAEICVKRGKRLIFRSWMSFDTDLKAYRRVSAGVEPHPNLIFGIKHCEGDFHRANAFSKVIGEGRHKQIIEVQCAREYEGKGAYPNYIAHGVIEGFEEHERMPAGKINSIREFAKMKPELYAGVWTWTRGGGWDGPYIGNEMWCDVNAWVMAQWGRDPSQSEESVFNRYAKERMMLKDKDIGKFRKLCLLSASAVVRGRNTTHGDMNPWWTRDQGIGWPGASKNPVSQQRNLKQKDESVSMWSEIVKLAESIEWADQSTRRYAVASAHYGRRLYEIYRSVVYLADAEVKKDKVKIKQWIKAYDQAWAAYKILEKLHPDIASLYTQDYKRHTRSPAHGKVEKLRKSLNFQEESGAE